MQLIQDTAQYSIIRFEKGERFIETLREWLASRKIEGAFFYGLGAAFSLSIGSYEVNAKTYRFKEFTGDHFEVLSLTGNVALLEGKIKIHSHISFADSKFQAYGGHLEDLEVGGTLEVYVRRTEQLTRKEDEEVGLALLEEMQKSKCKIIVSAKGGRL